MHDFLLFLHQLDWVAGSCRDRLNDLNANPNIVFVNADGEEVFLELDCFEVDEDLLFSGDKKQVSLANERIRDFFKFYFSKPQPYRKEIRFSDETIARLSVIASLVKAAHPDEAVSWGRSGDYFTCR